MLEPHKASDNEPESVAHLDLERYLGLWYEIGRLPLKYEDDHASDVTAQYSVTEKGVQVDNRSFDDDNLPQQALGMAQQDEEHTGRLEVTFLPEGLRWIPFTRADYWVLKIDDDYEVALIGTPDRKHLWLLARRPTVWAQTESEYLAEATRQGYDLSAWIHTPQSGSRVTDALLAGAISD